MKKFCKIFETFVKPGISNIFAILKEKKKTIIRLVGKFVIFICKTIIELLIDNLF